MLINLINTVHCETKIISYIFTTNINIICRDIIVIMNQLANTRSIHLRQCGIEKIYNFFKIVSDFIYNYTSNTLMLNCIIKNFVNVIFQRIVQMNFIQGILIIN